MADAVESLRPNVCIFRLRNGFSCVCSERKSLCILLLATRAPQVWVLESQASSADGRSCPKSEAECIDCSAEIWNLRVCSQCRPPCILLCEHLQLQVWDLESQASLADGRFAPKSDVNCIDRSAQISNFMWLLGAEAFVHIITWVSRAPQVWVPESSACFQMADFVQSLRSIV